MVCLFLNHLSFGWNKSPIPAVNCENIPALHTVELNADVRLRQGPLRFPPFSDLEMLKIEIHNLPLDTCQSGLPLSFSLTPPTFSTVSAQCRPGLRRSSSMWRSRGSTIWPRSRAGPPFSVTVKGVGFLYDYMESIMGYRPNYCGICLKKRCFLFKEKVSVSILVILALYYLVSPTPASTGHSYCVFLSLES